MHIHYQLKGRSHTHTHKLIHVLLSDLVKVTSPFSRSYSNHTITIYLYGRVPCTTHIQAHVQEAENYYQNKGALGNRRFLVRPFKQSTPGTCIEVYVARWLRGKVQGRSKLRET